MGAGILDLIDGFKDRYDVNLIPDAVRKHFTITI